MDPVPEAESLRAAVCSSLTQGKGGLGERDTGHLLAGDAPHTAHQHLKCDAVRLECP